MGDKLVVTVTDVDVVTVDVAVAVNIDVNVEKKVLVKVDALDGDTDIVDCNVVETVDVACDAVPLGVTIVELLSDEVAVVALAEIDSLGVCEGDAVALVETPTVSLIVESDDSLFRNDAVLLLVDETCGVTDGKAPCE